MKTRLRIPIYDVTLWVVVCDNIARERVKLSGRFGKCTDDDVGDPGALCAFRAGYIGIFFRNGHIGINQVAHECYHVSSRILEWCDIPVSNENQETAAYLNGYLLKRVM